MAAGVNNNSASDSNIPRWKQSLIEKRRNHRGEDHDAVNSTGRIPQWKREMLLRKKSMEECTRQQQQQQTADEQMQVSSSNGAANEEEHLVPVKQNPIWKSDLERRHSRLSHAENRPPRSTNHVYSSHQSLNGNGDTNRIDDDICGVANHVDFGQSSVFEDGGSDELVYGQGFVSRLLNHFQQLTSQRASSEPFRKRSISSDNLLDSPCEMKDAKVTSNSMMVSRSVDNLSAHLSSSYNDSQVMPGVSLLTDFNDYRHNTSDDQHLPVEDELPKPNTVLTVRTVFENISKSTGGEAPALKKPATMAAVSNLNGSASRLRPKTVNSSAEPVSKKSDETMKLNGSGELNGSVLYPEDTAVIPPVTSNSTESSKRKSLNLNLAEIPAANSRKVNRIADRMQSDGKTTGELPGFVYTGVNGTSSMDSQTSFLGSNGSDLNSNNVRATDFHDLSDEFEESGDEDEFDGFEEMPREGDPSEITSNRNKSYEFEGAGVIVSKSLLVKSKNGKQMLKFDDTATSTHEYPSEQSLMMMEHGDHASLVSDFRNGNDDDDSYYDMSLSSYKLQGITDSYQLGQEFDRSAPVNNNVAPNRQLRDLNSNSNDSSIVLTPNDSDAASWSNSATADLLF